MMANEQIQQPDGGNKESGSWFGFRFGERGTHSSRTMMFSELKELFRGSATTTDHAGFRTLIVDDNLLGKKTVATRRLTIQRLSELYGLHSRIPLFRVFRQLWRLDVRGREMLAFLVAQARDPLLRRSVEAVLPIPLGSPCRADVIDLYLAKNLGSRLNPDVRNKVARNVASTLTQAGFLEGRVQKIRSRPEVTPATVTLCLLLASVQGRRGQRLFTSEVVRLLDRPLSEVTGLARIASKQGLLSYRQLGSVVEISFPELLTPLEQEMSDGRV